MAHYAELDADNIVLRVIVLDEDNEAVGAQWCKDNVGGLVWKKTSYNTQGNAHRVGGVPFRKNYAGIGHKFDVVRDAFIPPKQFNSWILDEDKCIYNAPKPKPPGEAHRWDEATQEWIAR
jgi:hypothetical protein